MADDDKLTVRERRAQHAKEQARKDAPKNLARKAALPALVILILAAVAAGFWYTNSHTQDCPGHFHATFGIFIPGDNGSFQKVDFASPRAPNGGAYYDFGNAGGFSLSTHMHQSGQEQGSTSLGPSQLHFEPPTANTCVPLEDVLQALEADASDSKLVLKGQHSQTEQDGTWTNSGDDTLRFFVQDKQGAWSESKYSSWKGKQIPDGWSFMIAFGHYSDEQVAQMQGTIPAPISRAAGFTATTGGTHATANHTT
ncbi:MAG: hypothetical protein QOJ26_786 [Thermoplasmata archaeon]|jgi:hypothetical protein|nr:hypothetical protein [Thermoplasmata archaeon]MEA3165917.1 hypothetical protein [Thermoplasmata archaeon]